MGRCKLTLLILIFLLTASELMAQVDRYVVFFSDKAGTPYSVSEPQQFLTARSIARRTRRGIPINVNDLPVNESFVNQVRATGVSVYYRSRWMNCVLVEADPAELPAVQALGFVNRVEKVAPGNVFSGGRIKQFKNRGEAGIASATLSQLTMLGIDEMHEEEVRGAGVQVAVFDSGFEGVKTAAPFLHLFSDNQVKGVFDFIGNSNEVYRYDDHGTEVFSVIAAESTNYTGGAPDADFYLFVTEDVKSEYRVEEYNWLFAAERADSLGVDVIHSSLGYNTFDDSSMDYEKSELNGTTAIISQAARMAIDRGIVVVSSAGNEGNNSWRLVTPPSDINGIIAVGAITSSITKSSFSSVGPTADNRIKPDVVALGSGTAVVRPNGTVGSTSGTSVAAPLVTSLVAGLLQRYPDLTPARVYELITTTASQASVPDNLLGYGVPSYPAIRNALVDLKPIEDITIYPNPVPGTARILLKKTQQNVHVIIYDMNGHILQEKRVDVTWKNNPLDIDMSMLPRGVYLVKVKTNDNFKTEKILKE